MIDPGSIRPAPAVLVLLGLGLCLGLWGCVPGSQSDSDVSVGAPLPPFALPTLDGGSLASADLAGDVPVLINFWATWCGPCVKEIPILRDLHASGDVRVVSINVDAGGEADVRDFVRRHGIEYDVLRGDVGMVGEYGSYSIPYTLVLDGELNVRALHRTAVSASTLERDVRAAR